MKAPSERLYLERTHDQRTHQQRTEKPKFNSERRPGEVRVSWEFRSGTTGFVDCDTPESAKLIVADLRPDSRVWVGAELVQDGWPEA